MGTLAVVELPFSSGLPKDKSVNTFAIAEAGGHSGLEAAYVSAISGIYTNASAYLGGLPFGSLISRVVSRAANACSVKLYDITDHLDGSPHGSPYYTGTFTMATHGADPGMPEEVALCVTLEALGRSAQFVEVPDGTDPDAAPDRPRQTYTGRVYFGPFTTQAAGNASGYFVRPLAATTDALRTAIVAAADAIDTASDDTSALGVWSRKRRWIRGVEYVRTDDAFDTQRRRGGAPTAVTRTRVGDLVPEIELAS